MRAPLRFLALVLLAAGVACSEPAPVKEAHSAAPGGASGPQAGGSGAPGAAASDSAPTKAPMNTATFEIRLQATAGPTLTAVLHNASSAPHAVVLDSSLQPSELLLTGPNGVVKAFDSRSLQKFDNTVHDSSFTTVAAGADAPLETAKVQGSGGSAKLTWGPFEMESLAPGNYKAKVVLKSAADEFEDDQHKRVKKAGAWTGTVTSNEVSFQIP